MQYIKNTKYKLLLAVLIVSAMIFSGGLALAKSDKVSEVELNGTLPEVEGVYKIKNHPEMRLKVFVYHAKPTHGPTSTEQCNIVDPDSSSVVPPAGWKLPSTWTYRLNPSSAPQSVGGSNLEIVASNAYGVWEDAVGGAVTFTKGADTTINRAVFDNQNIVSWGRASGSALAVTYTWYNPTSGYAVEIDTIMNSKFSWGWSNPTSWTPDRTASGTTCAYSGVYDAQDILTHELGHTMGLNDTYTSDFVNNTMYGYGSKSETKKDTLTNGDKLGVNTLYN